MQSNFRRLRPIASLFLSVTLLLAFSALGLASQKKNAALLSQNVFTPDKGKLTIKLDGQTVGHEEFEITPSGAGWLAKGTAEIKASQASKVTGSLALQPNGDPISYEWTSQAEKKNGAHILFSNGIAKITLEMDGARPCTTEEMTDPNRTQPCFFEQTLSFNTPLIAVLDNNLYHQYAVLARLYDWSKRGSQTFSVFVPQELMPGTVTAESTGSATIDGKSYEGFRVNTSDLEVDLYLDSAHRLMRLEVPSARVSVVRD
ncbi:MAG TPA: hypothetical protein VE077_00645 [Candidatus Methylomirabilis sp.]|nr:hypothetical protein [Candidatus Methylomirabilis sp.]